MDLNQVLIHARQMQFEDKSGEDLRQMLIVCGNQTGNIADAYGKQQILHAVTMIHQELSRRQRAENHQAAIAEQQKLSQKTTEQHEAAMRESQKVQSAIQRLEKPHKLHWWLLWISIATAIFAGIAALDVILKWTR